MKTHLGHSSDENEVMAECPICGSNSVIIEHISHALVIRRLERLLGATGLNAALDAAEQTSLRRCCGCGLEFADPMRAPGAAFYQWLTSAGFKYPLSRWEWHACRKLLADRRQRRNGVMQTVVDVGCGDGKFLALLGDEASFRVIGLDINADVIEACRRRGMEVIQGDLAAVESALPSGVDAFCLWHVVEHIDRPVELLLQAKRLLREDGILYFSVPLTPMSYEHSWPDPFNAPPHHLTRWNVSSLSALADALEMRMQLVLPVADSFMHRVLRSLLMQARPVWGDESKMRKALGLLAFHALRPWRVPRELWRQFRHPRIDGEVRPDAVLVCLSR